MIDAFAKVLVDVRHDLAERVVLLVFAGQANAVGQGRKMIDLLRIALTFDSAAYLAKLLQDIEVATHLAGCKRQYQVFPNPRTHGPDGQFFGVLHREHGDRDGRRTALYLK
ncbi:hypothetical protein D3C81_1708420 [compost metagenome]